MSARPLSRPNAAVQAKSRTHPIPSRMPLRPRTFLLPAVALLALAPRLSAQDTIPRDPAAAPPPVVDAVPTDTFTAPVQLPAPPLAADSLAADSATVPAATSGALRRMPRRSRHQETAAAERALADSLARARQAADSAGIAAAQRVRLVQPFYTIGGAEEEALRVAHLRGEAPVYGYLLRAPSSLTPWPRGPGPRALLLAPRVLMGWNSDIPFSINDGALWAGRGANVLATAGVAAQAGPVRLVLAPELAFSENAAFDSVIPDAWHKMPVHRYNPPWQIGEHSIDLPYRMGDEPRRQVRAGQSSLTVRAGPVAAGVSTENQWWGPGLRNGLVLSNQAAGVEHLFLRSSRPLRTPAGHVEVKWIAGALRESAWFRSDTTALADSITGPRWRSFSAAALVLSPSRWLSLGVARSVYARAERRGDALGGVADAFTRWSGAADTADANPYEQITAVWARVVVPEEGAEAYVEWARTRGSGGLRGLLETPDHTQGYSIGLQWLRPFRGGDLRLQAEHTYIEESPTYAWLETGSWYASALVPQGYTHEGQGLGAAVGPGGSGQWFAADWLRGRGRGGLFFGRIRWAQDAYYDKPGGPNRYLGYDMSAFGGARGAFALGPVRLDAEYTLQKRWNYLFQSTAVHFEERFRTTNVMNHTVRLGLTATAPRLGRMR